MKINVKFEGDVYHDYGLMPNEMADASLTVPDKQWEEYVNARYEFQIRHEALGELKAKSIKK